MRKGMAVIRRRPSFMLCTALALYLTLSGCSLVAQTETPAGEGAAEQAAPRGAAEVARAGASQAQLPAAEAYPSQVALLLPLSGRAASIGAAVRDGFISAYYEQNAATRPRLKIYDVAAQSVASAYARALAGGAGFVVGPLTKSSVAAVAPLAAGGVPTLALNFLGGPAAAARNLYQFALLPEDEARIVARRLAADGRLRGVAFIPNGELGNRVAAAFTDELSRLGGAVLDVERYDSTLVDFSGMIRAALDIHEVKGEPVTHRADAAFVFIAGTPEIARLIMPQLKFHYAGDIPVYSMPDSFKPDPGANADIDGLNFPDMPWMISTDPEVVSIRDAVRAAWPAATARRDRLFAFGFDAYRLVPSLSSGFLRGGADLTGMTGSLRLDQDNRVRRNLGWAVIRDGIPQPR